MFLKLGFKSVTMDDIAKEMGISKKTIYKYFENKELLIECATEVSQATIHQAIEEVISHNYDAITENFEIRNMFSKTFDISETSPVYQLKKHYPQIYEQVVNREICQRDSYLTQNIRKGIEQGYYRKEIDPDVYTKLYYTLVFGIKETIISERESQQLELKALEYHIRAMATPKGIEELEKQLSNTNI